MLLQWLELQAWPSSPPPATSITGSPREALISCERQQGTRAATDETQREMNLCVGHTPGHRPCLTVSPFAAPRAAIRSTSSARDMVGERRIPPQRPEWEQCQQLADCCQTCAASMAHPVRMMEKPSRGFLLALPWAGIAAHRSPHLQVPTKLQYTVSTGFPDAARRLRCAVHHLQVLADGLLQHPGVAMLRTRWPACGLHLQPAPGLDMLRKCPATQKRLACALRAWGKGRGSAPCAAAAAVGKQRGGRLGTRMSLPGHSRVSCVQGAKPVAWPSSGRCHNSWVTAGNSQLQVHHLTAIAALHCHVCLCAAGTSLVCPLIQEP